MKLLNQIDGKSLIIGVLLTLVVTLAMGAMGAKVTDEWDGRQEWDLRAIPLAQLQQMRSVQRVSSPAGQGFAPFCIVGDTLWIKRPSGNW